MRMSLRRAPCDVATVHRFAEQGQQANELHGAEHPWHGGVGRLGQLQGPEDGVGDALDQEAAEQQAVRIEKRRRPTRLPEASGDNLHVVDDEARKVGQYAQDGEDRRDPAKLMPEARHLRKAAIFCDLDVLEEVWGLRLVELRPDVFQHGSPDLTCHLRREAARRRCPAHGSWKLPPRASSRLSEARELQALPITVRTASVAPRMGSRRHRLRRRRRCRRRKLPHAGLAAHPSVEAVDERGGRPPHRLLRLE
mmetsp:Transcript_18468/g.40595  ORF Transcript_18468/g.40595 Transcript_18468/m.40595 type:complete len:252 (-) Transcript_18468:268-1023(-)